MKQSTFRKRKTNKYDLSGEYGIGYTSKNERFIFDKEDYEKIAQYYWYIDSHGYVVSRLSNRLVYMHRLVCDCNNDFVIDHIHHKKNDNRKSELRICEHKNNCKNQSLHKNNQTGITGISIRKEKCRRKYRASIQIDGKNVRLGSFENIDDAIKARQDAEEKYYGQYSYANSQKIGGD